MAQETFIKAYQNLARWLPRKPFLAWLLVIAKNTRLDERRKRGREVLVSPAEFPETRAGANIEAQVVAQHAFNQMIADLPPKQQMLVLMRVAYDLPFAELAEVFGENEGTLRVQFHRLIDRLRRGLENERHL